MKLICGILFQNKCDEEKSKHLHSLQRAPVAGTEHEWIVEARL